MAETLRGLFPPLPTRSEVAKGADAMVARTASKLEEYGYTGSALREQLDLLAADFERQGEHTVGQLLGQSFRRYTRDHGEQPEPQEPGALNACPYCARVPCENRGHELYRRGIMGEDV